jgi:membrane protease YdiL (CAAX protease family)
LWKAQGAPVETLAFWLSENTVLIILSSVITTYFYNRARGSILVTGILHAAGNSTARLLYGLDLSAYVVLKALVALVVVLVGRMWKRLPLGQHAVYTPQWNAA